MLARMPFFAEFTCNGTSGYVARWTGRNRSNCYAINFWSITSHSHTVWLFHKNFRDSRAFKSLRCSLIISKVLSSKFYEIQ